MQRKTTTRGGKSRRQLTPKQRLRQLEPSLFFKGQTTSLLASVTEKELVSELRGGMVHNPEKEARSPGPEKSSGETTTDHSIGEEEKKEKAMYIRGGMGSACVLP